MRYTLGRLLPLLLIGCSEIPKEAYFDRGSPESLLDLSSEVVNVALSSGQSVDELADWVNQDQPTRAELFCMDSEPLCARARDVFDQFGVPVSHIAAADNNAVLIYERVLARDCQNRFIDNAINPYNLHHPTFGCSTASNMVQMVSDKRQFTNPGLLDYTDGEKAVATYDVYLHPAKEREQDTLLGGGGGQGN